MEREIKYGMNSAVLNAGNGRAMLTLFCESLTAQLADKINEAGDVSVTEIIHGDDVETMLRMNFDGPQADLLEKVCTAISEVYDTDTAVTYARLKETL